jgi:enoyl-CoA hydratase/carnithine racemase
MFAALRMRWTRGMSDNGTYDDIRVDFDGGIALILLNRPARKNAFTVRMGREIVRALDVAEKDDAVRVVVLSAVGPVFCVGADLDREDGAAFRPRSRDDPGSLFRDPGGPIALRMFDSPKPIVAAINGPAVGIGLSMTLAADIRIGTEGAKLGFPFAARGITPDAACSWFLPRLVGLGTALYWCMTARVFTAEEALQAGLLHSVHPADAVLEEALALARAMCRSTAPVAAALTRQLLFKMVGATSPREAHAIESRALEYTGSGRDTVEGVKAFLERRDPNWTMSVPTDLPDWYPWWVTPADGVS